MAVFSGEYTMQNLPPLSEAFIQHFGEMGSRWGVNRTVGQIYALLYLSSVPLNADDMVAALGVSRSNVSMGLKELESWRLVKVSHHAGDRREYFETPKRIWDVLSALAKEKRRREVEPTLSFLRDALMQEAGPADEHYAQSRMREMYDLIDLINGWFDDVQKLSPETLERLMRMGSRVSRVLEFPGTAHRD
jgi:DNA-binding transcriptional regulator GbsR (MarR family)